MVPFVFVSPDVWEEEEREGVTGPEHECSGEIFYGRSVNETQVPLFPLSPTRDVLSQLEFRRSSAP